MDIFPPQPNNVPGEQLNKLRTFKSKALRILANFILGVFCLFAGAVIVHGMVVEQCPGQTHGTIAGIFAPIAIAASTQQSDPLPIQDQKCLDSQNTQKNFVAGVIPDSQTQAKDDKLTTQNKPQENKQKKGAQSFEIVTAPKKTIPVEQIVADQEPIPAPTASAPTPAPVAPSPKNTETDTQSLGLDLDKLSIAVAMTETHNCHDTVGSALYNNCHGFKRNGRFIHFETTAASHAYFKQLWAKSYKIFPTYRLAQKYSGNDRPTGWLRNVTYYYNTL